MSTEPVEATTDLCEPFIPLVFGGQVDAGTYIAPGAWRGRAWPCPGRTTDRSGTVTVICNCPCHVGSFDHALPGNAGRTGVHPTEVPGGR